MTRHTRKVFGLAYRFTGRVDQAEDLTQEVFVKVYQTLGRYRETDGPFGGWLMAVARNHAIDQYRRGKQERLRRTDDPVLLETMPSREVYFTDVMAADVTDPVCDVAFPYAPR